MNEVFFFCSLSIYVDPICISICIRYICRWLSAFKSGIQRHAGAGEPLSLTHGRRVSGRFAPSPHALLTPPLRPVIGGTELGQYLLSGAGCRSPFPFQRWPAVAEYWNLEPYVSLLWVRGPVPWVPSPGGKLRIQGAPVGVVERYCPSAVE